MAHDLYVCYSNHDRPSAEAVCAALEAGGFRCWIAPRDVSPGAPWRESLLDAIGKSRAVVLILSTHSNESDHVKREILQVVQLGLPVIALRIDDSAPSGIFASMGSGAGLWINATRPPLEQHFRELLNITRSLLAGVLSAGPPQSAAAIADASGQHYEVFISYRREGGSSDARNVCMGLLMKNVRSFLDVDDLRSGHFDEALLRQIEEAPNFIVILSPHSLDRCANERDWLRREIAHAIKTDRNIVPVMMPGFRFPEPESLPEDIRAIQTHNAVDYSHDYFGPMINKILGFLNTGTPAIKAQPQTKKKSESSDVIEGLTFSLLVAAPDSLVGQRIGRYAIKEFIGAGGSGLVYRALQTALSKEVCIKIFYPLTAEAGDAANIIQRGARALAAMNHPHLIKVFDLETLELDASSFYLIMEFVRGRQLDEWSLKLAETETMPFTQLLSSRLKMALDITRALGAAHSCRYTDEFGFEQTGILHGDIKPANIIVRDENSPVILDFMMLDIQRFIDRGVVRPRDHGGHREPITAAYGTPGFMAPEQDRDGIVTVKSDIFSLGITLAHLFVPDSENPTVGLLSGDDKRLDRVRSLVQSMLAEDPAGRPRDMEEVAAELINCYETLTEAAQLDPSLANLELALEAEAAVDAPTARTPEPKQSIQPTSEISAETVVPAPQPATVRVSIPAAGDVWPAGRKRHISWVASAKGATLVSTRIELHKGETPLMSITSAPAHLRGNASTYNWSVPSTLEAGDDYRVVIIVRDSEGRESSGKSNGFSVAVPVEKDKRLTKRAKMGGLVGALLWGGLATVMGIAELNTGYGAGGIRSPFDLIVFIAIGVVLGGAIGSLITASRKGRIFGITGVLAGVVINMFLWKEREALVIVTALLGLFGSLGGALAEGRNNKSAKK